MVCATAQASRRPIEIDRPLPEAAPLPAERPAASPASLHAGTVLGSITEVFNAALATSYLADVRESLPLFGAVAHPGWLLRLANAVLARNVVLGPWIHVSSDVSLLGVVQDGERVTARAVVIDEFERRGHRFVTLDVALDSDDRPSSGSRTPQSHPPPGRLSASGRPHHLAAAAHAARAGTSRRELRHVARTPTSTPSDHPPTTSAGRCNP